MPETTASSAHTIFVRPPSGDRTEVTIPPGKQPGEVFTVMLEDKDAYPPDWPWHAAPPAAPAHSAPPPWAEEQQQEEEGEDGEEGAGEEGADEAALRKKAKAERRKEHRGTAGTPRPRRQAACPASMATQTAARGRQSRREARQEVPPPRAWLRSESRRCALRGVRVQWCTGGERLRAGGGGLASHSCECAAPRLTRSPFLFIYAGLTCGPP